MSITPHMRLLAGIRAKLDNQPVPIFEGAHKVRTKKPLPERVQKPTRPPKKSTPYENLCPVFFGSKDPFEMKGWEALYAKEKLGIRRLAQLHHLEYRRNRTSAVRRDNGCCLKCGARGKIRFPKAAKWHADYIQVHHVYGWRDNTLEHLRTLCSRCHLSAPEGPEYWEWERPWTKKTMTVPDIVRNFKSVLELIERSIQRSRDAAGR